MTEFGEKQEKNIYWGFRGIRAPLVLSMDATRFVCLAMVMVKMVKE